MPALRRGLNDADAITRTTLFGGNAIDIASRTTFQLLMDEVLHPFYIFQVFSIILWAFDDYYCEQLPVRNRACRAELTRPSLVDYAFAIAIISVVSIISTLIETKGVSAFVL